MSSATAGGALPHSATVVSQVAGRADQTGDAAAGVADQVHGDVHALLHSLGGGPPAQLREAGVHAASSVAALREAGAALHDAATALRAFAARVS